MTQSTQPSSTSSTRKPIRIALFGGPGAGKCLGKGTPVLMYDGTIKPVEAVVKDDLLMGPDSKPRKVLGTTVGTELLYRVTPVKGDSYIVNESHILSLKMSTDKCGSKKDEIVNISVQDYLRKPKAWREKAKGWRTGVKFPVAWHKLPLDPYVLGVWLGDGHTGAPRITTEDNEIYKALLSYIGSIGIRNKKICIKAEAKAGNATTYGIRTPRGHKNPLVETLRSLEVYENKHIPQIYKCAMEEQRLQILAGLLDTDGSLSNNGFDYVSKVEQLSNDVAFIARSLGLAAYVKRSSKTCTNTGTKGIYFRVSISGNTDIIPTRIPRKQASPRKQAKDVLVTGISVEPVEVGEYYGFELDSDGLFLLGDFTVTHNTTLAMAFTAHMKDRGHNWHYVHEYARDFIDTYGNQALEDAGPLVQCKMMDKQIKMENKLPDSIDGLITDSPTFLSWMYGAMYSDVVGDDGELNVAAYLALKDCYKGFLRSLAEYDFVVKVTREKPYIQDGTRKQTEEEAKELDNLIETLLRLHNVNILHVVGSTENRCQALENLVEKMLAESQGT